MALLEKTIGYLALENTLLRGMNDYNELTFNEKQITPIIYKHNNPSYQNVHQINLEADLSVWNNGAWFILKPRFYNQIMSTKREDLNLLISSFLQLNETMSIDNSVLNEALILNTDNDVVFEAFIMMKIMLEKLKRVCPQRARDFEDYQTKNLLQQLSTHEQNLANSLWPGIKDKTLWQQSFNLDLDETVGMVFACLQEMIAQIAINSCLQSISLNAGLKHKNLGDYKDSSKKQGICDLTTEDLDTLADFLCSLPETKRVYEWLVTQDSQIARTLSQLLEALLEKPKNVQKFLQALNLQQGTAKLELEKIEEKDKLKLQIIKENTACSEQVTLLVDELSQQIHSEGNAEHISAIVGLKEELRPHLETLKTAEIDRKAFKDLSIGAIKNTQPLFEAESSWYNYLTHLAKVIANFFIGLVYDRAKDPNRFFKLNKEEDIIKFEMNIGAVCG